MSEFCTLLVPKVELTRVFAPLHALSPSCFRRSFTLPQYWMNPIAVHFSSITVSKLCLVTPEGYVHPDGAQLPINTAGFHIRALLSRSCDLTRPTNLRSLPADSAIHKGRPELQAAAHCHSLYGKAWSVFGKPIDILTQDACLFYDNQAVYKNFGGIVLAPEEGKNIAETLGPKVSLPSLQGTNVEQNPLTLASPPLGRRTRSPSCRTMVCSRRA